MSVERVETCDVCGEDVERLSFNGGTRIYRGRFRRGGWFWKGTEEREPKGDISICSECWRALGAAVREAREARPLPGGTGER